MNANDVAAYLQHHSDFFESNAELLAMLSVPHPDTGEAISLTERQLMALRDKLRQLQEKMADLVRFGEENDAISEKVHRLVLNLIEADGFDAIHGVLNSHLLDDFEIPHIAMRVWDTGTTLETPEFAPVSEVLRFFAADLRHPYCGPAAQPEITAWFGEIGAHVRSVALLPLRRDGQIFGLLALGSEEAERFYPEMGTLYVSRIGELVSAALLKYLG